MTIIDISGRYNIPVAWPRLLYVMSKINAIAIHHSVTPTLPASASRADELRILDAIHASHKARGLGGFGYHGASFPSGRTYKTTRWSQWGANVGGHNNHVAGLVAVGTYTTSLASRPVMEGLAELVDAWDKLLKRKVSLKPHGKIYGGWTATICPGLINRQVSEIRGLIREEDILLVRAKETGAIYTVGAAGKRHIGPTEYKAWLRMGFRYINVAKADIDAIPDHVAANKNGHRIITRTHAEHIRAHNAAYGGGLTQLAEDYTEHEANDVLHGGSEGNSLKRGDKVTLN